MSPVIERHIERFEWPTCLGISANNIQRRVTTSRNGHFTALPYAMIEQQAPKRIRALEERAVQRDRETAEICARLLCGAADFVRLAATLEAIRASPPIPSPAAPSNHPRARSAPSFFIHT
jgi:hypothetical protein